MNARGDNDDQEETGVRAGDDAMGMIKVDLEAGASMDDEEMDRKIYREEARKGGNMTMTGDTIKEEGGVKRRRKEAEDHREKKLDTESGNTTEAKSGRVKEAL